MCAPEEDQALAKDGVEAHLQELLAEQPGWCGDGLRLVRPRVGPPTSGPRRPDVPRAADDEWVAVEIKRVAGLEAVEQLTRYLDRIRLDPAFAQLSRHPSPRRTIKRQGARARTGARHRVRRGRPSMCCEASAQPDLRLFAA